MVKAKETKAEAPKSEQLAINVNKQEFIRTRDALITSWVSLEGALRDATRAYISHSNAVLGGSENLDLSKLDLTSFLGNAFPPPPAAVELKDDAGDDTKAKAKRVRKPKDPNAPKRPLTAYLAWLGDNREKIHGELGPGQGRGGISSEGTKRWHALSEEEKQAYKDKYERESEKYKEELAAYTARGGGPIEEAAAEDDDVPEADETPVESAQAGVDSDAATSDSDSDSDSEDEMPPPPPPKEPTPPVKTPKSAAKSGRKKAAVPASSPPLPASSPAKSQNAAFTAVNGKRKKETKTEATEEPKRKRSKRGEAAAAAAAPAPAPAPASTPAEAPKEAAEGTPSAKREKSSRKKSRKSVGGDA